MNLGEMSVKFGADTSGLSGGIADAANKLGGFGSMATGLLGPVGGILATIGGAALGLGAASVSAAADFQSGMSKVGAYVGLTKSQTDALGNSVLNLAAQMGQSPKAMADALYPIMSSGYSASQSLDILKLSAMTAAASGANMATIADALTTSLKAMHAPASSAGIYMDMINKIVAEGKGQVSDYAAIIGKLSLAAGSAHVPFADMGAALATLTTHGFPSVAQASTSLSNLFTQIGPKVDTLAQHAQKLGLSFDENTFKTDSLSQKLAYLQQITGGNQGEMLKLLGGSTLALKAFNSLTGAAGDYTANLKGMQNAQGATASVFQTTYGDWNNATARLSATFQVLLVKIGQGILPLITPLVNGATSIVAQFGNWISSSNIVGTAMSGVGSAVSSLASYFKPVGTLVQQFGQTLSHVDFGGLTKGFGGLSGVIDAVKPGFQQVAQIIGGTLSANFKFAVSEGQQLAKWWTSTMQPAIQQALPGFEHLGETLANTVAPALAQIWSVGQQLSRTIVGDMIPVFEKIMPILVKVGGIVAEGLSKALQFLVPYIVKAATAIGQFAGEIATRVAPIVINFLTNIENGINTFMKIWNTVWPILAPILKGVWDELRGIIEIAWSVVSGIIKVGLDLLSGNWGQAWTDVKDMFSGIWDGIKTDLGGAIEVITGLISGLVTGIVDFFQWLWDTLTGHSIIPDMVADIIKWFTNLVTGAISWIENLDKTIVSIIVSFASSILSTVSGWVSGVLSWFMNLHTQAVLHVQDMITDITTRIMNFVNGAAQFGAKLIQNIASGITGAIGNVTSAIGNVVNTIGNFLPHSPAREGELSHLNEYGPAFIKGFADGITRSKPQLEMALNATVAPFAKVSSYPSAYPTSANAYAPAVSGASGASGGQPQTIQVWLDSRLIGQTSGNSQMQQIIVRTGVRQW